MLRRQKVRLEEQPQRLKSSGARSKKESKQAADEQRRRSRAPRGEVGGDRLNRPRARGHHVERHELPARRVVRRSGVEHQHGVAPGLRGRHRPVGAANEGVGLDAAEVASAPGGDRLARPLGGARAEEAVAVLDGLREGGRVVVLGEGDVSCGKWKAWK